MTSSKGCVIALGYIVRGPLGGLAWHHLQYVLGLLDLGYDVSFLEYGDDYASCYDPGRDAMGTDPSYGINFCSRTFSRTVAADRWAYFDVRDGRWVGPLRDRADDLVHGADIVLNLSGTNALRGELSKVPVRVLVDTDPVFTQIRHLTDPAAEASAVEHNAFFTFGENFGHGGCTIPDDGLPWKPTRQPVALECWRADLGPRDGRFTTVMQWDSYQERAFDGRTFGMKSRSFADYLELPRRTRQRLELAIGSASAPRADLAQSGWAIENPLRVTETPWSYQNYIRESKGEFSVAKHGYAATHSGWFSERSAVYLASGRPVVTQETGFSQFLPAGSGLHAFNRLDEAVIALDAVDRDYEANCRAARRIAEEFFDSRTVLEALISGATSGAKTAG